MTYVLARTVEDWEGRIITIWLSSTYNNNTGRATWSSRVENAMTFPDNASAELCRVPNRIASCKPMDLQEAMMWSIMQS